MKKIDTLLHLINDLLDVARLEAGRLVQHRGPVDVGQLIEETVGLMQPRARRAGDRSQIFLRKPATDPCRPKDMEEILNNLISNAINYSPGGGR